MDMIQWRIALRRMMRAGMVALLPARSAHPRLSSGAFCVVKSDKEDRFIADRRPRNFEEKQIRAPRLPYAPRLRRLRLRPGEGVHLALRDLRHCFYIFGTTEERMARQTIGPRVPRSWFDYLDDEAFDDAGPDTVEDWWRSDLFASHDSDSSPDHAFGQPAVQAVMMGDINAVTAIQHANRRILIESGAIRSEELMLAGAPFPSGKSISDMYVDDLMLLTIARFGRLSCSVVGCGSG